jgi:hypothetical protein
MIFKKTARNPLVQEAYVFASPLSSMEQNVIIESIVGKDYISPPKSS